MKKVALFLLVALTVTACQKRDLPQADPDLNIFRQNLSPKDFSNIEPSTITRFTSSKTGQQLLRAGFTGKDANHDFIVVVLDKDGVFRSGKFVHVEGKVQVSLKDKNKKVFDGILETSSLKHTNVEVSAIKEGYIMALHSTTVQVNNVRTNFECADCTLPEVIVSSSHSNGYDWTSAWMSIWWMFNDWPPNEYIAIDYSGSGGGGGGGGSTPPVITIDIEAPENKEKIDTKKYTDCFGKISDNLATYSLTIATDLPVDGHPETFFNWNDGSPGHAFIQLSKSNPYETVTQNIGFYPASSWTVMTGHDVNSKTVDDGGHEYNARYTITVTAAQFQAAIGAVATNSSMPYNISDYNCTDFALAVFGAAGGSVPMYRHPIPNFGVPGGSNTPQGLYEAIRDLNSSGRTGANMAPGKEYTVGSHGPCN